MTSRSRRYFYRKSKIGITRAKAYETMRDSIWEIGMCASRVWLDENGNVRTHILSTQETCELDLDNLSDEYTINKL